MRGRLGRHGHLAAEAADLVLKGDRGTAVILRQVVGDGLALAPPVSRLRVTHRAVQEMEVGVPGFMLPVLDSVIGEFE